jgi:TonB family protein
MSGAEVWKSWEGRVVDGKFPLRQLVGGSEHSAVFVTERPGQPTHKFALKLIPADPGDADRQLVRWRAAAQLSHPNLIRIYETGRCGLTLLYAVMEYAEEDLSQILPQRALTPAEVTDLLPPLLDALSYVHGRGFVHSRIKPSNILAVGDQLKLSSDQIASASDPNATRRRRDVYDAPETAAGIVSPAGDLWSVGATLVAALTQNVPLAADESEDNAVLTANLPEPFRGIARECLHLDPKRRCSIADIVRRLQPAARSVPADLHAVAIPRPGRSNRPFVTAAVLALALVVGFAVFYSRGKSSPEKSGPVKTDSAADQPATQTPQTSAPSVSASPNSKTDPGTTSTSATSATATVAPPASVAAPPPAKAGATRGEIAHQVLPDVPQSAKNTITGTIKVGVRVEVDASGKVTAAKLTSPGPSKYFANLALKAAQRWEFSPPSVGGQPAGSAWLLRFKFRRSGTEVDPERVKS